MYCNISNQLVSIVTHDWLDEILVSSFRPCSHDITKISSELWAATRTFFFFKKKKIFYCHLANKCACYNLNKFALPIWVKMQERLWKSWSQNHFINLLVTVWQVLLLVNLEVCVMRDWLINWNGSVGRRRMWIFWVNEVLPDCKIFGCINVEYKSSEFKKKKN